jgi:hypothetical protein
MKNKIKKIAGGFHRMVHFLVLCYLRRRLNGRRQFKPPVGWHSDFCHPRFHLRKGRLAYSIKYRWWRFESRLWETHGDPIRKSWDESFTQNK